MTSTPFQSPDHDHARCEASVIADAEAACAARGTRLTKLRRQVLAMDDARAQNWYEVDAAEAPTLHPALPGFMDLGEVELPDASTVFMCGPLPFMRAMRNTLIARGIPTERIHYEVFGPDLWAQQPAA